MPPSLPTLTPKKVIKAFENMGYKVVRHHGSHTIMARALSAHQPTIPFHSRDLPKGTLRAIIRQSGLTVEEFIEFL